MLSPSMRLLRERVVQTLCNGPAYRRLRHLGEQTSKRTLGPGNHTRHRSTRREGRDFFNKEVLARGHACSQRHADAHKVQSHLYTRQGGEHL